MDNFGIDALITYRAIEFIDLLNESETSIFFSRIQSYGSENNQDYFITDADMVSYY